MELNVAAITECHSRETLTFLSDTARQFGVYLLGGIVTHDRDGLQRELRRAEDSWGKKLISERDFEKARDDAAAAKVNYKHALETATLQKESLEFELRARRLRILSGGQHATEHEYPRRAAFDRQSHTGDLQTMPGDSLRHSRLNRACDGGYREGLTLLPQTRKAGGMTGGGKRQEWRMAIVHQLKVHLQPATQFEKPIPRTGAYGDLKTGRLLGHGRRVVGNGHQNSVCF